jgi:hypothetical protein
LTRWEQFGLACFFALLVPLGVVVEMRSAFMSRRMGDLDCYLRAGWAVRVGADLYDVTDDNGFHYNYPPLLAILAAPLADPPAGFERARMLPFAVSVGVWYLFNLLCLALAVHWLAGALEQGRAGPGVPVPEPGSRAWWVLRLVPVLACVIPIGHTLIRGQANLLLLALLCGALAGVLRGQRFQGGLCLAGAICLKIFPAFLLLFPLWRRDGRFLAGCAGGLVLGLALIPAAALGPSRAWHCYHKLRQVLVEPALGAGTDQTRAHELTNQTATDSQSLLTVLHNTLHPHFATRPPRASRRVRLASGATGGLLTLLTLLAAATLWVPGPARDRPSVVLFFGLLILNMLLLSPVCHLHYFSLSLPLVMALLAVHWQGARNSRPATVGLILLLVWNGVANLLPHLPALLVLREGGLAMYAALSLWLVGVVVLWRRSDGAGSRALAGADLPRADAA